MLNGSARLMPRRRGSAFTLIELLVVISIISLLVSILLPSLAKVRRVANKTYCATLMRGYGIATDMYATDNREVMMDSYMHLDSDVGIPKYWGVKKMPEDVARCPSDASTESMGRLGRLSQYGGLAVSIGCNENMLSCSARPTRYGPMAFWVRRDQISGRPDSLMVWSDWQNNPGSDDLQFAVVKPGEGSMGSLCFRHDGDVANAVFLDGHASEMRPTIGVTNNGHDLAGGADWGVTMVGKFYKCYYPFGVGATQTAGDDNSMGNWPGLEF